MKNIEFAFFTTIFERANFVDGITLFMSDYLIIIIMLMLTLVLGLVAYHHHMETKFYLAIGIAILAFIGIKWDQIKDYISFSNNFLLGIEIFLALLLLGYIIFRLMTGYTKKVYKMRSNQREYWAIIGIFAPLQTPQTPMEDMPIGVTIGFTVGIMVMFGAPIIYNFFSITSHEEKAESEDFSSSSNNLITSSKSGETIREANVVPVDERETTDNDSVSVGSEETFSEAEIVSNEIDQLSTSMDVITNYYYFCYSSLLQMFGIGIILLKALSFDALWLLVIKTTLYTLFIQKKPIENIRNHPKYLTWLSVFSIYGCDAKIKAKRDPTDITFRKNGKRDGEIRFTMKTFNLTYTLKRFVTAVKSWFF